MRFGIRIAVAALLVAAAAVAGFFAFRAITGKYFFRSEPTLKKAEIPLDKKALADRKPALIEVLIDQDDMVFPMCSPGAPLENTFDESDLKVKKDE